MKSFFLISLSMMSIISIIIYIAISYNEGPENKYGQIALFVVLILFYFLITL